MKRTSSTLFALVLVLSLVLIIAGPMATPVQGAPSGPKNGSTAGDDDSIGTVAWSSVNDALTQDNSCAEAILTQANRYSHYLEVTDFGFDMPSGATIEGIVVEVDRRETNAVPLRVWDNSIRLVKGGAIGGDDKALPTTELWPGSDTNEYVVYGNSTDLWGLNWTPGDISGSDFGVAISAAKDGSPTSSVAYVDHIRITIYYSVPEYYLTMEADPEVGGTATDETQTWPYMEDEVVEIKAQAATGYEFVNWTTSAGGTFGDEELVETTFTMPACNVTVTANFEVETGPQELPTVTTLAATGIGDDSVTLNMAYTLGDYSPVYLRFAYRESGTADWSFTSEKNTTGGSTHTRRVTGLTAGTEYDFRAELRYNSHRIDTASILQFTTDTSPAVACFIATAAYGTPGAEQIDVLREFRDDVLLKSAVGSEFVSLYYRLSPPIADLIAGHDLVSTIVRDLLIDPIVWMVQVTGDVWRD
jgi:hypothetical protein